MSYLTLDFQANSKEKYHHENVIDKFLYGHVMGEQPVNVTLGALQVNLDIGLKECPVVGTYQRQVSQQHSDDYAQQKQDTLSPGLTGKLVTLTVELEHALVPGVNRDKFHLEKLKTQPTAILQVVGYGILVGQLFYKYLAVHLGRNGQTHDGQD